MSKYKKEDSFSYTLGTTLTIELLKNKPNLVTKVFFNSNLNEGLGSKEVTELCLKNNIEIIKSDKIFRNLNAKDNCYVIGEFNKYFNELDQKSNHLVLVSPSNDGNLGTIIRSALGFDILNIAIIKPAADIFDPKVIRSSMGAIFSVNVEYFDTFLDYQTKFDNHNFYPFMLQSKSKLKDTIFTENYSLIFGKEDSGLDDTFLKIGHNVIIPHNNSIDSLNLPIAVSIALYEVTKNKY